MKKDIFKGKIKPEYISYIWFTIIFVALISFSVASLVLYSAIQHEIGSFDRNGLLIFSVFIYLIGVLYSILTIVSIRKYPKYPKLRRFCLNSDEYFIGSNSKEFHARWRGKYAFNMVTQAAEKNKGLENIKYPKKYKVYLILCILGIIFMFVNIIGCFLLIENITILPKKLQSEGIIVVVFIAAEIIDMILSFVFAFRVKNIRKAVIDEYRKNTRK